MSRTKGKKGKVVFKRKDSPYWHYDFALNGRRFRGSTFTVDKERAQEYVHRLESDIYDGTYFKRPIEIEIEKAFIRFWEEHGVMLRTNKETARYLLYFKGFFVSKLKLRFLSQINDDALGKYITFRRNSYVPHKNIKRHPSDALIRRELASLGKLQSLSAEEWNVNPPTFRMKIHLKKLERPRKLSNFIEGSKQITFIMLLPVYLRLPVSFAIATGLRRGNAFWAKKEYIDWSRKGEWQINGIMYRQHGAMVLRIKSPLKGEEILEIPITDVVLRILVAAGCTPDMQEKGFVFLREVDGKMVPLGDHKKAISTALKKAGIRKERGQLTHLFRHTASTNFVTTSKNIRGSQKVLGHKSVTTTERYSHTLDETKVSIIEESSFASQIRHKINEMVSTNA